MRAPVERMMRLPGYAAAEPRMSRYGFQTGLVAHREAIAGYMERHFGDVCVLPEPGYPPYIGGAVLAGADVELYPLGGAESFLVELERVAEDRLARTRQRERHAEAGARIGRTLEPIGVVGART